MWPIKFNLSSNSQNWLEHRVSNKNPKNLKNHLFNLYKIDQLIITQGRIHKIMINYNNPTSQFYQFWPNWIKSPIRIHTSPRNFNFSKFTKLIKLNHQDQVYIIATKPNDQFQNIWLESTKIPKRIGPKIPTKCMKKCMKTWK